MNNLKHATSTIFLCWSPHPRLPCPSLSSPLTVSYSMTHGTSIYTFYYPHISLNLPLVDTRHVPPHDINNIFLITKHTIHHHTSHSQPHKVSHYHSFSTHTIAGTASAVSSYRRVPQALLSCFLQGILLPFSPPSPPTNPIPATTMNPGWYIKSCPW